MRRADEEGAAIHRVTNGRRIGLRHDVVTILRDGSVIAWSREAHSRAATIANATGRRTADRTIRAVEVFGPAGDAANARTPDLSVGHCDITGQLPTLPHTCACSTIGAEGLNFRVRDGNGWVPLAMVTQKS